MCVYFLSPGTSEYIVGGYSVGYCGEMRNVLLIARATKATCALNECLLEKNILANYKVLGAYDTVRTLSEPIGKISSIDAEKVRDIVYIHNTAGRTDPSETWGTLVKPVKFPHCKRLLTVYDRAVYGNVDGAFEEAHDAMLDRILLNQDLHSLHVFCDPRAVCSNDPKTTPFDVNFATRLFKLLNPNGADLVSGTWINVTESASGDGRAIAGVMTGGIKLPLGATI